MGGLDFRRKVFLGVLIYFLDFGKDMWILG